VAVVGSSSTAIFQVTGTTTISPASVDRGNLIKISLSDWIQSVPDEVRIGGVMVPITDEDGVPAMVSEAIDGETEFYVKVGGDVTLGTKTLVLLDAGDERLDSTSVEITSTPLSVSPSSAVAGQEITVQGSGFSGGAYVDLIEVGGTKQDTLSNGNLISTNNTFVTSGGRVVLTFLVPDGVTDGSNTVGVTDETGRIGEVSLSVPEPEVSLEPASSRRGSTVVVSGSGFPADNFITISYDGNQVDVVRSNNSGNWAAEVRIPNDADIGSTAKVMARVEVDHDSNSGTPAIVYDDEAEHSVPGSEITLSTDTARGGDTIIITGEAFPAYQPVVVQVAGLAKINTGANTNGNGDFSVSILLPALDTGTHLLEVTVDTGSATKVLTVPAAAVEEPIAATNDTADVFAAEIAAGNLARVWMFSNEMQAWSFFDPRPAFAAANTYTQASTGDIVWVSVTAQTTFQGQTLFLGWNLISLD
jgi:hypothetical protein